MTDSGLSDRLRQKSRRAGLAVGLSMALTIGIFIGGATAIYAALIQPLSQFVPIAAPAQQPQPASAASGGATLSESGAVAAPNEPAQPNLDVAAVPTAAPAPEPPPTPTPEPTATADAFEPTHQIRGDQAVNLRAAPSRTDSQVVRALPPATPLQFLDEEAPTEDPVTDGQVWMRFRTQEGEEGWVREIDTAPYAP
jgi:hypothetical protein